MYRPRRSGNFRNSFTFGGRMPASIGFILVAMLVATVGSWLLQKEVWAVYAPQAVVHGQIWRLVTWPFVQDRAQSFWPILGGFMLWQFGSQLVYDWGEQRFLWTFFGLTVGAGLITLVPAFFLPAELFVHLGMWPVIDALLLMWCLRYPDQQMTFWGILPMTGRTMAMLVVGGTLLSAIAAGGLTGIVAFTMYWAALFLAWVISGNRLSLPTRRWKLAWRDYVLERQARRRSKHLKVVRKNGHQEPPQWLN